ncbi:hypothetical protein [Blastopirellula marina]|uniref:DUF5666 domain-containing protein n=1 Tax=Blastopirellula marina DSM 3645 TaxID=314230 RepID=A3ZTA5_9BACT|nr:hypothetical protein [Blastopirellula marina]EAQ80158.1 hypothetical protein DSM3645_19218 [Blastopirellula marina DSM 3645]
MFTRLLLALLLSAVIAPLGMATELEVKVLQEWSGKTPNNSLKSLAPESGFVTATEQWKKLWTAWRPGEELPKIDFTQQIVLVGVVDGPNQVMLRPTMQIEEIRFVTAGTRMAGPGFGYKLVAVNKAGVKRVNGQPINAASASEGSIQVTVIGKLQTGLVAIGGETTGTTITAKGITWELELGSSEELRKMAETLDGKQAKVTGSLERRAGVEVAERWIVTVKKLTAAGAN